MGTNLGEYITILRKWIRPGRHLLFNPSYFEGSNSLYGRRKRDVRKELNYTNEIGLSDIDIWEPTK